VIQLKNVSKFYYSKGMIASGISRVNLSFDTGEFVVITGESGSGKTTLLNVISGLDSYEEGEMYINGEETSHYLASDFEEYRKKYIGNIFQDFNLVNSYTVYQNIELILLINGYKKEDIKRRVPAIIKRVGLEEYTKTKVSKLSGGQKQRVAIARALAKDTDVIVADEPTGNLDSVSADGIVKLLSEIASDKLVIVVTHNYEQFAAHATRKIKMHDGRVAEDEHLKPGSAGSSMENMAQHTSDAGAEMYAAGAGQPAAETERYAAGSGKSSAGINPSPKNDRVPDGNITAAGKLRLGARNTFNIVHKFILMLIVFLFVVFAVSAQYSSYLNQQEESDKLGYNYYFTNYSEDRVVLKKTDESAFTDDDFKIIKNVANIKSISVSDILLDSEMYLDSDDYSYEVYTKSIDEFDEDDLVAGKLPEADNEIVFAVEETYAEDYDAESILDNTFSMYIGEDTELRLKVVGFAYYEEESDSLFSYGGDIFVTDGMLDTILEETYSYQSTVTTTINGKEQQYEEGTAFYRIVPSSGVEAGEALVSSDLGNFYDNGVIKGRTITVKAENMYYTKSLDLEVTDTYTKSTFTSKTGDDDYDNGNGTIYVSRSDYDKLFKAGNFQISVYVDDVDSMEATLDTLESMGYVTLALKDTLVSMISDLTDIMTLPMIVIVIVALFFIAYFVIRLILRSRASYFSILRMLGMARKNIRRILDVEMLLTVDIAYAIFLACVALVKTGIIRSEYILNLIQYMDILDYIVLYAVILLMSYLISGKFARSLFKKTAMGTYREEE